MKIAILSARILMGLIYFVFGLNGFLHFIPTPPLPGDTAMVFIGALVSSGYLMFLVKGMEVVIGAMLLTGFYVPLALTLIAPITINIFLFHAFLAPAGLMVPAVLVGLQIFLFWAHKEKYSGMLQA